MARPRAASYDDQRDRILAQAAELFARQGYVGTSMNEVAAACGVSKAALYHYVKDKGELLLLIAMGHVQRLEHITASIMAQPLPPQDRLRELILRFVAEYAHASHEHRVLTEDVKFLSAQDQKAVIQAQRRVVRTFAGVVMELRPELERGGLHKALTMLLFGMINWLFTWLRPQGAITHEQIGPMVCDLFFGGLHAVTPQVAKSGQNSPRSRASRPRLSIPTEGD